MAKIGYDINLQGFYNDGIRILLHGMGMMISMNFILLAALVGEAAFAGIAWLAQGLRMKGVSGKSILAACGLGLPVWIGLFFWAGGAVALPCEYMLALGVWLVLSFALMLGSRFSPGIQSPGEGMGLRFVLASIFAVLVDLFVFQTVYSTSMMLAIGLFFAGGVLLNIHRFGLELKPGKLVKVQYKLAFAAGVALAEICGFALFKYGASLQTDVVAHVAVFQTLLSVMFLIVGGYALLNDKKTGYMSVCSALLLAVLAVVAGVGGGLAIAGLPIALFIMLSLVRASFVAIKDMQAETAGFSAMRAGGIVLVAAGIVAMAMITGL